MTPMFSILHATYGRPEKAVAAMRMWFERAENPGAMEYIFAVNSDDIHSITLSTSITSIYGESRIVRGNFRGSASAWDAAAKVSTGDILLQAQDDVDPPMAWDAMLLEWLEGANTDINWWRKIPLVIAVSDGYRRDKLLCTAIMNRARYEQCGEFLHSGYLSMFSDDELTYRAFRDERDGRCAVIHTDLVFRHEHHYHNPTVPLDATYLRENSAEAYRIGAALFAQRNPEAGPDGLRTGK